MVASNLLPITKRSPTLGLISALPEQTSVAQTMAMFSQTCFNRYFELQVAEVFSTGIIKMPVYLSVGQEHISAALAQVLRGFLIFGQHRAHSYYLSFGGHRRQLVDELLHRATGCAGGMGGSASIHSQEIGMYGHSGLMGDQVPIAVGAALGSGKSVIALMGDAAAEEDYVYGAMGYAVTKKAPVLFLCEDNDLSILTHVAIRRTWSVVNVAQALGMPALDITDDPWLIIHHARQLRDSLPAFLNVRTCRQLWHAGTGTDGPPEWNRFELIKDTLRQLGLEAQAEAIEAEARQEVKNLWDEQLQKQ